MASTEQKGPPKKRCSWYLRRQVALEYLNGGKTLMELSAIYRIPNQSISRWVQDYRRDLEKSTSRILVDMTAEEQKQYDLLVQQNAMLKKQLDSLQPDQQLQRENEVLKNDLEFARMKTKAMEII